MKRNIAILGAVVVAIAIILIYNGLGKDKSDPSETKPSQAAGQTAEEGLEPGQMAPSFKLTSLDGQTDYEVGGKRDKPLIINFWASWCGPCDLEAPDLMTIYDKYKDKLDFYGVNETKHDTVRGAKDFVKEKGLTFPILMDKSGTAGDDYKVYAYPVSYIIDRNGLIRYRLDGGKSVAEWEKMLKDVL